MDLEKTGELLSRLRKECGMTQKQVAEKLQISDRTVSKWERGAGLPDVSLLKDISALYDVDIEKILDGNLEEKGYETYEIYSLCVLWEYFLEYRRWRNFLLRQKADTAYRTAYG